jgi:hypothetical protein
MTVDQSDKVLKRVNAYQIVTTDEFLKSPPDVEVLEFGTPSFTSQNKVSLYILAFASLNRVDQLNNLKWHFFLRCPARLLPL